MSTAMDDLQNRWKDAKKNLTAKPRPAHEIIALAKAKKKSTLYHQYGNIGILTMVLVLILGFFYYLFPFQDTLSKAGVAMMAGGLILRIVIEFFSAIKSLRIDLGKTALKTTDDALHYYKLRKTVNGPVTLIIVFIYSAGFYMLTPEFSKYFEIWIMVLMDVSYLVAAGILIWQIRKGVLGEMKNLSDIVALRKELTNDLQ